MTTDYPSWVCSECGRRFGNRPAQGMIATWHPGICGICNEEKSVTEPRDFGHLREGWEKG